jgi:hypothetical protein
MKQYFNAAIQLKAKDNLFKEQQRMAYFTEGKQNNLDVPTVKNSSADRSNNNHNLRNLRSLSSVVSISSTQSSSGVEEDIFFNSISCWSASEGEGYTSKNEKSVGL